MRLLVRETDYWIAGRAEMMVTLASQTWVSTKKDILNKEVCRGQGHLSYDTRFLYFCLEADFNKKAQERERH